MSINEYKTIAGDIVLLAKRKGADTVEVSVNDIQKFEVTVRKNEIETLLESGSSNVSIVITKSKRKSVVSSSDLKQESIAKLVDDAMQLVNYSETDESLSLPPKEELGVAKIDLKQYDDKIDILSANDKIEVAKKLENLALKHDNRLYSEGSEVATTKLIKVFANSLGFCEGYSKTNSYYGISLFIDDIGSGENKSKKQSDGWYSTNVFYDNLDPLEEVARVAAERTLRKIGAKKPKTQIVPVIFEPQMGASFISSLASASMGSNIYRKQSFLIDKLSKKLGSENLTIIDNPLLVGKIGSRLFDSEGVKARENVIFRNGIFNKYMLDNYSANKLKLRTTGNSGGFSNLYLENGKYSLEEMIGSVKNGLLLTFMSGHGANIITGDYSRGAQGIWIEDGKLTYSVNEFTITSKFEDMMNNLIMIGNDLKFISSISCPTIKIDKLTIGGN